jgi:hypothetical protein
MWTLSKDDVVTKTRLDIQSQNLMFTIIWNPNRFYVINRFLNHIKMNSDYFMTNLLILFEQAIFPRGRAPHEKQLVIHHDNCSVRTSPVSAHWLEEHSIIRM